MIMRINGFSRSSNITANNENEVFFKQIEEY